jgi:ketosteroid isomerase-like protein
VPKPLEELGYEFLEALERHDADALVAVAHPEIEFRPTSLRGRERFRGHDALRHRAVRATSSHSARVISGRALDDERFVVMFEIYLDCDFVQSAALIGRVKDGLIISARAYLTDEALLEQLGLLERQRPQNAS